MDYNRDLLNFGTSWRSGLEEGGAATMRLLVNLIQQGLGLGGILLQAPSSEAAAVFDCPSCCSAERHRAVRSGCLHPDTTSD